MESKSNNEHCTDYKESHSNTILKKYTHDIRNMVTLDNEMLCNIRNMSNVDKMAIIMALNDVISGLKTLIETY
jgi:hypothetical protein